MSAGSLLAFCVLALNLLQGYGCSGANGGKQEWQTPPRAEEHKATPKGDQKKMDDLVQRILKKDPTATLLAKQIGPDAASAVRHLVTHEDPVVRELALRCLEQSGGDGISSLFGAALLDESPTVRAAGLSGLNKFLNPSDQKALLVAFDRWAEAAEMQEQVALLFGRIKGASPDELRSRLTSELAPLARQGVIAAPLHRHSLARFLRYPDRLEDRFH